MARQFMAGADDMRLVAFVIVLQWLAGWGLGSSLV